ncbi:hypothetical protein GCM10009096_11140 [Parasphingorhabdus litoris]|uniref:Uncharacterized protein n=1 Tax=Parasphingorhabdus litoris TaxID=394733 RepID=A0ABP3K632_9SPHN|nr:hypothetical protein [Parasphingorhabdus litoris]
MKKFLILPIMLTAASCGSNDEIASGTFDDGEGGKGSYSISGDNDDSETVIKSGDGEVRIATGSKAVTDLPMGIKLYPGANIQSSMTGMGDGKSGAVIVFESSDDQDDVISFYKDQMKAKGIEVQTEVKSGDMQMIAGQGPDGEGINISVVKDDDVVTATLMVGEDN